MRSVALCCLLMASLPAVAAQSLRQSEQAVINFGFATQLGSGIYSLSGRTLQVYTLPFAYDLPGQPEDRIRWRLTLPLTIGFVDFKPVDVIENGLPQHLDSWSFVPGIEADLRMNRSWLLQPFLEAGIARDSTQEVDQRVYAAGVRSFYDFGEGVTQWQQYDSLSHVVLEADTPHGTDDYTRVQVGLSARRPFDAQGSGRRPDFLVYGFVDWFTDAPAGPASAKNEGSPAQYEVGITFGATERWRIGRIPLPRVGFGYRFGADLSVYRLVLGTPY